MDKDKGFFVVVTDKKSLIEVCYRKTVLTTGLWRAEDPSVSSLPILAMQLISIMSFTRVLLIALKPLRQPRIVAEILGGVLLGPTLLAEYPFFFFNVFPLRSLRTLETLGNLAIVYHMFLVGLELDFKPVIRSGKKALTIAFAGIIFSVPVGWVLHRYLLLKDFTEQTKIYKQNRNGPIFWGIALATTNFPELARILADLKLLHSEVGRLALSSAVISDLCSWFLFLLGMAAVNITNMVAVGSTLAFIAVCTFLIRPALSRILTREREKEDPDYSHHTSFVLAGVVLCGFITDALGSHSIVGPFVLGAIMPKGELSRLLTRKVGDFVPGILMPLFYVIIGLRVKLQDILNHQEAEYEARSGTTIYRLVAVVIVAFAAKIVSTFAAGLINKMSPRDSLALGVLMNTKGLLTLIVLSSGRDLKALNKQTFDVMVITTWVMTAAIGPFLAHVYKSSTRPSVQYKERNIESVGPETELRILACFHNSDKVSGIINLLEASNPTKQSPIHVLVVHLVELTGHASAMLIVHDTCKTPTTKYRELPDSSSTSNGAFGNYARKRENITVQKLTAVSAYATMHEDICNLAEENQVTLIIIPFHYDKSLTDGATKSISHFSSLNNNLIANAQCSVGVFVDHGFGKSNIITESNSDSDDDSGDDNSFGRNHYHFAMVFIGGKDDREALTYAWRMAGHPKVRLTVIRINYLKKEVQTSMDDNKDSYDDGILMAMASTGMEEKLDHLYLDDFRLKSMDDPSIKLEEKMLTGWVETLKLINSMENEYDMYIVGRRHGDMSPSSKLLYFSDSDELGIVGDALASSSFLACTSILVVQQGPFYSVEQDVEE